MSSYPHLAREKAELVALSSLPGATARRMRDMISLFGSPAGAWEAIRAGKAHGPHPVEPLDAWAALAARRDPHAELETFAEMGIFTVVPGEKGYPALLAEIPDRPWALYYRGRLPAHLYCSVAVVGSRKATPYGLEVSRWLARELSRAGVNIVSGAAYGIDSAAHAGALEEGCFTTAVLGCGIDVAYPRSHASLLDRIASNGCVLSEYSPGTPPSRMRFPERNRIIAGLSRAVIVVEAAAGSGALITVDHALAGGRDVMAVPGPVDSSNSEGTNALIRTGASLVSCPDDVLHELGLSRQGAATPAARPVDAAETDPAFAALSAALARGLRQAEELARETGFPISDTLAALARMEVGGSVVRGPGGSYHLAVG